MGSNEFTVRTAAFWLDVDGQNRWAILEQHGSLADNPSIPVYGKLLSGMVGWAHPVVVDLGKPVGECNACGHGIQYEFFVTHPIRGQSFVGSECINKTLTSLSQVEAAKAKEALRMAKKAVAEAKAREVAEKIHADFVRFEHTADLRFKRWKPNPYGYEHDLWDSIQWVRRVRPGKSFTVKLWKVVAAELKAYDEKQAGVVQPAVAA